MKQHVRSSSSAGAVEQDVTVQSFALEEMLSELDVLENETEIYDEDCIKPTPYAFARLRELLKQSAGSKMFAFPSGTVYPDGSGALRAEWMRSNLEVALVVFPEESDQHYIFYKEGQKYNGDYKVTPENLSIYLQVN